MDWQVYEYREMDPAGEYTVLWAGVECKKDNVTPAGLIIAINRGEEVMARHRNVAKALKKYPGLKPSSWYYCDEENDIVYSISREYDNRFEVSIRAPNFVTCAFITSFDKAEQLCVAETNVYRQLLRKQAIIKAPKGA
jgi:hypothetical protein